MKRNAIGFAIGALVLLAPVAYGDMVIDPLDDLSPYISGTFEMQGDVTAYAWDTADTAPGSPASLRMEYTDAGFGWGQVQARYIVDKDLTSETTIRFWAKGSVPDMRMNLTFAVPNWGEGASWIDGFGPLTTTWTQYEVPMADFVVNPYFTTGTLPVDWSNVGTIQIAPAWSIWGTLWVDHIEAVGSVGIDIRQILPSKGAIFKHGTLPEISVSFTKNVTGVDAGDLTVNGSAATGVTGSGMGPYVFVGFEQPATGTATVVMAPGGITDGVYTFTGESWTYEIEQWMKAIAPLAVDPVVLDGVLSPGEWDDANHYYFDGTDSSTRPGWLSTGDIPADDWSCTFSVKHDADYIYIGVYVYDDIIVVDGPNQPDYRDDRMEIYFDADNSDSTDIEPPNDGPGGFQITYDTRNYGETWFQGFGQWWWGRASSDTVHVMTYEFQVAKEVSSTVTMVTGGTYGFDLSPDDADTPGDVRDHQIWWNARDNEAWRNEVPWGDIELSPYTKVVTIPDPPTNLTATAGNQNVVLQWDAVAGRVDEYRIKQSESDSGPYAQVATTLSTSIVISGLTNGTTYYFVVTAANSAGESGNSNQASATPPGALPARHWENYR